MTAPLSSRDLAVQLLAIKVTQERLTKLDRQLREQSAAGLMVGERVSGALDPADAATLLGFVQLTKGRESVTVTDTDAVLAWAEEHAPAEVVTTRRVRPSFLTALTAAVKRDGGWVHPGTSEVLEVPGIAATVGAPVLTVKPTAEADALVAQALADRRLQLTPAPATPDATV